MEVFVGNLPLKYDANELGKLFEQFIKPKGLFAFLPKSRAGKRRSVSLPRFKVIEIAGETPRNYGHVVLFPESLAHQAIAGLQGATLRGNPVYVREYFNRAYINDRRRIGWRNRHWGGVERRLKERRQGMAFEVSEF